MFKYIDRPYICLNDISINNNDNNNNNDINNNLTVFCILIHTTAVQQIM